MKRHQIPALLLLWLALMLPPTAAALAGEEGVAEVRVDFGGEDKVGSQKGQVMEVVATGVGLDPEKALQNAYSHAIEQAIGVLVDAETIVKNDQIVCEQVLTFSRGYIESFDVVKRSEQDGLHYVRVRARVAADKLANKLKASNVAMREIPGELFYLQSKHEILNDEQAAEMFREAMKDFKIGKLFDVKIVGEPAQTGKDDVNATLQVVARLYPNLENWETVYDKVTPVLGRIAYKRTAASSARDKGAAKRIDSGKGHVRMIVLKHMSKTGQSATWDAYSVPATLDPVIRQAKDQPYALYIALLDEEDRPLAEVHRTILDPKSVGSGHNQLRFPGQISFGAAAKEWWVIGPAFISLNLFLNNNAHFMTNYTQDFTIPIEKLRHVKKCVAYIKDVSPF